MKFLALLILLSTLVGKSPDTIWTQVEEAIRTVLLEKETAIMQSSQKFKQGKFFEMMRFDFVIDDQLNVFLMEVSQGEMGNVCFSNMCKN